MKLSLVYLLILALALLKEDTSLFAAKHDSVSGNEIQQSGQQNISNSTHKRSLVDLFASAADCDDNDDEFESVKKKTGSTVSFLLNNVFEKISVHSELKRTQKFSKLPGRNSQPVYIFQKELLI